MKEYRKTYLPFAAWLLALMPVMLGTAKLAEKARMDSRGIVALMMTAVVLMLMLLFRMIRKGGYVYWISGGPSFEQARDAGEAVRGEYAQKHFAAMLKGSAAALILLAAEYVLGAHEITMVLSVGVCIIAAAISTIRIRWPEGSEDDSEN